MTVELHEAEHRFVVTLPDGEGELRYRLAPGGVLDLYHAGVDRALRGRGVGDELAQAAFAHARTMGLKVRASCPFIVWWVAQHPEVADLMVERPPR